MTWLTADRPGGVQVIPLDDLLPHRESESCWCDPVVSLHNTTPHGRYQYVRKMISHNSADGRD